MVERKQSKFCQFKEFHDCPSPILVEDENSLDEESENSTLEKQIKIQYWFPETGDPNSSSRPTMSG